MIVYMFCRYNNFSLRDTFLYFEIYKSIHMAKLTLRSYEDVKHLATGAWSLPIGYRGRLEVVDVINWDWALLLSPTGWSVFQKGRGQYYAGVLSDWGIKAGSSGDSAAVWAALEQYIDLFVNADGTAKNNLYPEDAEYQTNPHKPPCPASASHAVGEHWCDLCTLKQSNGMDWVTVYENCNEWCVYEPESDGTCLDKGYPPQAGYNVNKFGFTQILGMDLPNSIHGTVYVVGSFGPEPHVIDDAKKRLRKWLEWNGLNNDFYVSDCRRVYPNDSLFYVTYTNVAYQHERLPCIVDVHFYLPGTAQRVNLVSPGQQVDIAVLWCNDGEPINNVKFKLTIGSNLIGYIYLPLAQTIPCYAPASSRIEGYICPTYGGEYNICAIAQKY